MRNGGYPRKKQPQLLVFKHFLPIKKKHVYTSRTCPPWYLPWDTPTTKLIDAGICNHCHRGLSGSPKTLTGPPQKHTFGLSVVNNWVLSTPATYISLRLIYLPTFLRSTLFHRLHALLVEHRHQWRTKGV